jgi:hypothetical protein
VVVVVAEAAMAAATDTQVIEPLGALGMVAASHAENVIELVSFAPFSVTLKT